MALQFQEPRINACSRCEVLPKKGFEFDRLYLWPPLGHSTGKLKKALENSDWKHSVEGEMVIVELDSDLEGLLSILDRILSSTEKADTRCLLKDRCEKLSVSHIPQARSLTRLHAATESEWLVKMIEDQRFVSHFQPIVHAHRPTEIFGYESLLRGIGSDGELISPHEIFGAAKNANLLFQTDLEARRTAIRDALSHGIEARLFVNFTPTSIYDPVYCLRSTVKTIDQANVPHGRVVFEVTESEALDDTQHLLNIVDYYKESGFKVALDDVGSGYSSLNLLHKLKPDFIKLDMQLIKGVTTDSYKAKVSEKLLEMANELGVQTVVEGVETEDELQWAQSHGASFIQGYLIARPASVPQQLA